VGAGALELEVDDDLAELSLPAPGASLLDADFVRDSWQQFERRVVTALRGYAAEPGMTVLVCHTGVIEVSFVEFGRLARRSDRFAMAPRNASITTWARPDGGDGWRLETYNDCQHLWVNGSLRHRAEDFSSDEELWAVVEPGAEKRRRR
jgi:broad specificity phosphatase PhoE